MTVIPDCDFFLIRDVLKMYICVHIMWCVTHTESCVNAKSDGVASDGSSMW